MNLDSYSQEVEELEGLDTDSSSWGDYPIDDLLIRHSPRTIHEVIRRINQSNYIMDPEFQRDFIWDANKQSKLIESVIMRIPLPVFYMAENEDGKMVVVDGLQRLSTFKRFLNDELRLRLPDREELNKKNFSELPNKLKNRVEDCNLIFYIIDSKVPERARLDIFERVNGGVPLTRQQMRNCLYMGEGTKFLKVEAGTGIFKLATGGSLNPNKMRDREFVNRFCAFKLLGLDEYHGDMDDFLAEVLQLMNKCDQIKLSNLSSEFRRSLNNNYQVFDKHAFRKYTNGQRRSVINAAYWDVMTIGLSEYEEHFVKQKKDCLREAFHKLLEVEDFKTAITSATNDKKNVTTRFALANKIFREVFIR